jgi:hypothetical protein
MQVFLFSGHLVDAPGRTPPRFPASRVPAAGAAIDALLDELQAAPGDLALTQGASGGDLLFAEACLRRGLTLQLCLPQPEPAFIETSLRSSQDGEAWVARWLALRRHVEAEVLAAGDGDVYERCNRWLLERALVHGAERLRFICLWDGAPGAAGGTGHMVGEAKRSGAAVHWIDIRTLHP